MMSRAGSSRFIVHLHDVEQSIVEEDIKKYLTESLGSMTPPPPLKQIELLAKRSRNLFIYAVTIVRYIFPEDVHVDSNFRLRSMLATISHSKAMAENNYENLDQLYTTVLKAVFNTRLDSTDKQGLRGVLWTIVCAREPITVSTIASLASLSEDEVWTALQSLRSVVHVPEDNGLISTLHSSFPEYMVDESRSKRFYCNELKANETLVHRCFDVMASELKFNVCALNNSYLADSQVDDLDARVLQCISPTLSYACRYWGSHLRVAPATDNTHDMLLNFLAEQLLFWMEVLSLSRCIGIGAPMMQQAQTWLWQTDINHKEVQKKVSDARNFVTWFAANACSQSTPHIYISALALCAKSSWVYQHYVQRTTGLASISISQHEEAVLAIWSLESAVYSVVISPDGNRIASGSDNGSVHIFDMHTGAVVAGPFQGHTDAVWSIAFSPDGRHIASGSYDQTVIVWDAETGRIVTGPLHKHTNSVRSVAFSPDGRRLVSVSADTAVIVWDAYTGAIALGPLEGHSDRINSVAFSPDGRLIASGSHDQTIRLWDAFTGAVVNEPCKGHKGPVKRVIFSPDGSQLASCSSDNTIRVWDIKTGIVIGSPFTGHSGGVWSIAFSHNGRWIVSGGEREDSDIIVWDVLTGSVVLGPLSGHTLAVNSVAFTPDDTRIVSSSDDRTIRIWDVQPQNSAIDHITAREYSVGPVAFLHNRMQFISSSSTSLLKLWDIHTGMTAPHEFEGQAEAAILHAITISPDDTLVAVGSNDLTIRVWNVLTGKLVCQPLRGHRGLVRCLGFSPDGAQLCSGSDDATVVVWDIDAGSMVGQLYTGHTRAVISIAFSPDAAYIASSSADCTIRIWNTPIGALVHTLNVHNASVSSVTFSPDGSFVVSGSIDGSVLKWDVRAGTCLGILLESVNSPPPSPSSNLSRVNWVQFSPDGTCIASGLDSSIRLVDAQGIQPMSELVVPRGEKVRWVGYSPDGTDIISASISEEADAQEPAKEPTQSSSRSPNILRVWRTAVYSDRSASSSTPHDWSYEPDGRVISSEGLVMWIPADLIPHMEAYTKVEFRPYYNPLVLSPDRFINIDYQDLCIGNRWTECYVQKN
ncbi:vegetative incompatibility protein HET-E-1, partial [Rhizoctonia solani AG-3 Rhs1AP]